MQRVAEAAEIATGPWRAYCTMPFFTPWMRDEGGRARTGWRLLSYLLVFAVSGSAAGILGHELRTLAPRWLVGLSVMLLGGGGCLLGFWVLRTRLDRRPWSWIGLTPSARMFAFVLVGFLAGALMIGAVFGVEFGLGWIEPGRTDTAGRLSAVIGALFAALGVGLMEELLLRGAVLQNLGERLPLWAATLATGVLFGVLHLANPAQRVDVPFVASAVVATLMLVLARFVTGGLGWAVGWHAGWDWMQDLLGLASPGEDTGRELVHLVENGPRLWTGQAPSIEGGLLPIVFICLAAAVFWALPTPARRRWNWRSPLVEGSPWRAQSRVGGHGADHRTRQPSSSP